MTHDEPELTELTRQRDSGRFREELEALLNRCSMENGCDTPDFILAEYLLGCLDAFDVAVCQRTEWYRAGK